MASGNFALSVPSFWKTVMPSSSYMAALDPDLSRFQRGGGKLILWHGWNDQHISPQNTLLFWDAMRAAMGGDSVDRFARLYLFPGMAHCGGGEGPNTFDVMTPLMSWVERGTSPYRMIANNASRSRPVYPYPAVARYDGSGSTDDAANFFAYIPRDLVRNDADWVGQRLFSGNYQTWPRAVNGKLVLSR
ncbi:tannase/feruloyl esterase family alpha/beta hydrolase [Dactylosporangium sp. NPDC051541]|uniref:tannase/feruloyl esterase family alpha/beta hydrolase n=1 Tax=Dactylosporangium sp. NPDC051541 TaxID=3363977 RepID=UPI00379D22F9